MPQMFTRVLYTPAGTKPDFGAGRTKAALLAADATVDDLRLVVEEGWLADQPACCPSCHGRIHGSCHQQVRDVYQLRREVARRLDELFRRRGHVRHLAGRPLPHRPRRAARCGGPHNRRTRGRSTQAYRGWDILIDHHRLPAGWGATICGAIGFIDPLRRRFCRCPGQLPPWA